MKIAQFYHNQRLCLGVVADNAIRQIDFQGKMIDFIKSIPSYQPTGRPIPLDRVQFAPPVINPSKIIGIGLNYMDHIRESNGDIPEIPLVFAKFPSSLIAHNEQIRWDTSLTNKVDFEAELAVIIGKTIHDCPEKKSMESIFGYTCANDVSARDLQFGDGQWVRGKTLDTFCPLGPWVVTSDEIADPHSLDIKSRLNGQIMQDSNSNLMIFKLPQLISFLSKNFTLCPGDVILTGTPHGVGTFRNPSVYMKDGDEIVVEIESIGLLRNFCRAF